MSSVQQFLITHSWMYPTSILAIMVGVITIIIVGACTQNFKVGGYKKSVGLALMYTGVMGIFVGSIGLMMCASLDYANPTLLSSTKNSNIFVTSIRNNGADISFVADGKIIDLNYRGEIKVDNSLKAPTANVNIRADGWGRKETDITDLEVPNNFLDTYTKESKLGLTKQ